MMYVDLSDRGISEIRLVEGKEEVRVPYDQGDSCFPSSTIAGRESTFSPCLKLRVQRSLTIRNEREFLCASS